jgi:hypothetical protein
MQAQALYSTQLAIAATENDTITSKSSLPENDPFKSADLSLAKNSDGYYSINTVEVQLVKEAKEWNTNITKKADMEVEETPPPPKDAEQEIKNANEVFGKNYIRFKPSETDNSVKNFIYTDAALIQKHITPSKKKKQTSALTYLKITLVIDGLAGISCGEYFHIDGVPEIYNKNGYFQVENVKTGIDEAGWKTTIEAGFRIKAEENV